MEPGAYRKHNLEVTENEMMMRRQLPWYVVPFCEGSENVPMRLMFRGAYGRGTTLRLFASVFYMDTHERRRSELSR